MAAKWRHTYWMFLCFFFHKTLGVIHVIRGLEVIESVSSTIMSIWFQLSPYSEQEAQNNIAPILFLIEQNDFGI